jgi:3-hydroxyacyl-[acyl-carrier-protein] dehydratase
MMNREDICAAIPHREPFLMVDEVVEQSEGRIVGRKTFSGREDFFAGHYPGFPIVPGVLLCEAAMQCGAILLASHFRGAAGKLPVATRINDVRFKRVVRPGETIRMEVDLVERLADAFFLKAKVTVEGQVAVRFEFACTATEVGDGGLRSWGLGLGTSPASKTQDQRPKAQDP